MNLVLTKVTMSIVEGVAKHTPKNFDRALHEKFSKIINKIKIKIDFV